MKMMNQKLTLLLLSTLALSEVAAEKNYLLSLFSSVVGDESGNALFSHADAGKNFQDFAEDEEDALPVVDEDEEYVNIPVARTTESLNGEKRRARGLKSAKVVAPTGPVAPSGGGGGGGGGGKKKGKKRRARGLKSAKVVAPTGPVAPSGGGGGGGGGGKKKGKKRRARGLKSAKVVAPTGPVAPSGGGGGGGGGGKKKGKKRRARV